MPKQDKFRTFSFRRRKHFNYTIRSISYDIPNGREYWKQFSYVRGWLCNILRRSCETLLRITLVCPVISIRSVGKVYSLFLQPKSISIVVHMARRDTLISQTELNHWKLFLPLERRSSRQNQMNVADVGDSMVLF